MTIDDIVKLGGVVALVLAAIASIIAAVNSRAARRQSVANSAAIQGVHTLVNSEMEAFKRTIIAEARTAVANAFLEGAAKERGRADAAQALENERA